MQNKNPTWREILCKAAGVYKNVGLKGGVEVIICTEGGGHGRQVSPPTGALHCVGGVYCVQVFYLL